LLHGLSNGAGGRCRIFPYRLVYRISSFCLPRAIGLSSQAFESRLIYTFVDTRCKPLAIASAVDEPLCRRESSRRCWPRARASRRDRAVVGATRADAHGIQHESTAVNRFTVPAIMSSHAQCPECQSSRSRTARGRFAASGTQAFRNRECKECGTVWRPSCPRGVAVVFIAAGFVLPLSIIFIFGAFPNEARGFWSMGSVFVIGISSAVYGIRVLRGRAGQLRVLGKVETKAENAAVLPAFRPGDVPCVSCGQPVSSATRVCASCGWTQPC